MLFWSCLFVNVGIISKWSWEISLSFSLRQICFWIVLQKLEIFRNDSFSRVVLLGWQALKFFSFSCDGSWSQTTKLPISQTIDFPFGKVQILHFVSFCPISFCKVSYALTYFLGLCQNCCKNWIIFRLEFPIFLVDLTFFFKIGHFTLVNYIMNSKKWQFL